MQFFIIHIIVFQAFRSFLLRRLPAYNRYYALPGFAKLPHPENPPAFLNIPDIIVLLCLVVILPTFPRLLPQSMPFGKSAWPAPRCCTSIPPRTHAAAISVVHAAHSSLHYAPAVPASFIALHVHAARTTYLFNFLCWYVVQASPCPYCQPRSFLTSAHRALAQSAQSFASTFGRSIPFVIHLLHSSHFAATRQQA